MGESFLISLREGFEAALVVSIVLAFIRRGPVPQLGRWVWLGAGAAIAVSVVVGVVLHVMIDGLEGSARARTFAVISAAAAALLTWMIFWMRTHGRELQASLQRQAASALADRSGPALASVAFAAVVREGLETALFLLSITSLSSQKDVVAGTLAGIATACALGAGLYHGSKRINMRLFFDITGGLIILFAAGLLAKTVLFLQRAGDLGTFSDAVYDLTAVRWLTVDSQVGRFLAGIFGWDPRPSFEQVFGYVAYVLPIGWVYFRGRHKRTGAAARRSAAGRARSARATW